VIVADVDDVDTSVPAEEIRPHHVQSVPQVPRRTATGIPATQGETGRSRSWSVPFFPCFLLS